MNKYNIHKDFEKYENLKFHMNPLLLPIMNAFIANGVNKMIPVVGVSAKKRKIKGYQNGMIELTIYEPSGIETTPCLIYLHGGAFVFKAAPHHISLAYEYAIKVPCKVVVVDYRLLPKYDFTVAVEDCYAAFEWICTNAESLGIDKNRIAIGGDSSGGTLTAAVTQMARDRKAPDICFQMLIYPFIDAGMKTESMKNFTDTPVLNAKIIEKSKKLYLKKGVYSQRAYATPIEADSCDSFPKTYIEVAEFDPLRDGGLNYAEILQKSGIDVELHITEGTIHGFDMAEESEVVHEIVARRIVALKKAFYPSEG